MEKGHGNYDEAEKYNEDYSLDGNIGTRDEYDVLEDKWYEIEEEYRTQYSDLTDEDLYYEDGRFNEMLDNIGRRRGRTRSEIRTEIENW
jgi:hypothetical protein